MGVIREPSDSYDAHKEEDSQKGSYHIPPYIYDDPAQKNVLVNGSYIMLTSIKKSKEKCEDYKKSE